MALLLTLAPMTAPASHQIQTFPYNNLPGDLCVDKEGVKFVRTCTLYIAVFKTKKGDKIYPLPEYLIPEMAAVVDEVLSHGKGYLVSCIKPTWNDCLLANPDELPSEMRGLLFKL